MIAYDSMSETTPLSPFIFLWPIEKFRSKFYLKVKIYVWCLTGKLMKILGTNPWLPGIGAFLLEARWLKKKTTSRGQTHSRYKGLFTFHFFILLEVYIVSIPRCIPLMEATNFCIPLYRHTIPYVSQ